MAQIGMTQMTKQIFFDRKQGTMFMDDPAAIADYCMRAVSYTHLDVYKRQVHDLSASFHGIIGCLYIFVKVPNFRVVFQHFLV